MPQPASSPTTTATPRRRLHRPVLLIVGIMLIAANLRAALTSVGPLLEQIQQQLALSATAAGLINSLPLILFAVLSPLTPALAKRIGIERTRPRPCAAGLRHRATFPAARRHALAGQHPDRRRHCLRQRGAADAGEKRFPASRRRDDRRLCGGDVTGCRHRLRSGGAAGCPADLGWRFSLLCWGLPALLALLVWLPQLRRSATPATKEPQPTEPQRYRSPRAARWVGKWRCSWGCNRSPSTPSSAGSAPLPPATALPPSRQDSSCSFTVVAIVANFVMVVILPRARDQRAIALGSSLLIFIGVGGLLVQPASSLVWLTFAGLGAGSSLVLALSFFGLRSQHHHQATLLSGMAQSVGYLLAALGPTLFGLLHDLTDGWRWPLIVLLCLTVLQMLFGALAGRSRVIS